jgi:hypothetical protein
VGRQGIEPWTNGLRVRQELSQVIVFKQMNRLQTLVYLACFNVVLS